LFPSLNHPFLLPQERLELLQVENDLLVQQAAALDAELGRLAGQLEAAHAEVAAAKAEAAAQVAAAASRAAGEAGKRSKALQERVKVWCWQVMGFVRDSMVAELQGLVSHCTQPCVQCCFATCVLSHFSMHRT